MADLTIDFKGNGIIKYSSRHFSFKCYVIPKESVKSNIDELSTVNGIYFLINDVEAKNIKRHIYVGKTTQDNLQRFQEHKYNKDFWNKLVLFNATTEYFDETITYGLERIFIDKYKDSNLYEMNQNRSHKDIDNECFIFVDDIVGVMDYLQYPSEKSDMQNDTEVVNIDTNNIFDDFNKKIEDLNEGIEVVPWQLYYGYRKQKRNLCAVWVKNYGLEIEFYCERNDLNMIDGVYDTRFRKRGHKHCALKITSRGEIVKAIEAVKTILKLAK